ncbi:hypothetical protein GQ53DRAFT_366987 [Thozetella sp. PMI_491]|nr:hypothetical protein GQ53DRAFT_366987 [Thozetella sp. PMI_491]
MGFTARAHRGPLALLLLSYMTQRDQRGTYTGSPGSTDDPLAATQSREKLADDPPWWQNALPHFDQLQADIDVYGGVFLLFRPGYYYSFSPPCQGRGSHWMELRNLAFRQ